MPITDQQSFKLPAFESRNVSDNTTSPRTSIGTMMPTSKPMSMPMSMQTTGKKGVDVHGEVVEGRCDTCHLITGVGVQAEKTEDVDRQVDAKYRRSKTGKLGQQSYRSRTGNFSNGKQTCRSKTIVMEVAGLVWSGAKGNADL